TDRELVWGQSPQCSLEKLRKPPRCPLRQSVAIARTDGDSRQTACPQRKGQNRARKVRGLSSCPDSQQLFLLRRNRRCIPAGRTLRPNRRPPRPDETAGLKSRSRR